MRKRAARHIRQQISRSTRRPLEYLQILNILAKAEAALQYIELTHKVVDLSLKHIQTVGNLCHAVRKRAARHIRQQISRSTRRPLEYLQILNILAKAEAALQYIELTHKVDLSLKHTQTVGNLCHAVRKRAARHIRQQISRSTRRPLEYLQIRTY